MSKVGHLHFLINEIAIAHVVRMHEDRHTRREQLWARSSDL